MVYYKLRMNGNWKNVKKVRNLPDIIDNEQKSYLITLKLIKINTY